MENALRRIRQSRGIEQQELARLVGVSRQALGNIESGEAEPGTDLALRLARVLRCPVEELFWLESAPLDVQLASGAAPGRAALAEIGGRWVAHALPDGVLDVSADALLSPHGRKARPLRPLEDLRQTLIVPGCDPALLLLAAHLGLARQRMVWLQSGSTAALEMLARGEAHAAGAHLFDEESGEFNVPFVQTLFPGRDVLVVNLARWRAGLGVARGNPVEIRGVPDLGRKGVRLASREPGSGARKLLDRLMAKHGVRAANARLFASHAEVAQAVALGAADAGVTTESAALAAGLRFIPLAHERSDLVVPVELSREPRGARMLDVLSSAAFRRELGALAAYEAGQCGDVVAQVRS